MKHVWLVQDTAIESTDMIYVFSSEKRAQRFVKETNEMAGEEVVWLLGKRPINGREY